MLSPATLQAIAQSQIKHRSALTSNATCKPPRKPVLRKLIDVLFEARRRRAEIEIEQHRRFYDGHTK